MNSILTHYTKDIESLLSIIKFGFFYSFSPTRTFEQIFKDANIDAEEPDDHGMVCFTELDVEEAYKHRSIFGEYGIAVSKDWAISVGAKEVEYIKRNTFRYKGLLEKIKSGAPALPFGYLADEQNMPMFEKIMRQMMLGHPASGNHFCAKKEYIDALKELYWIQIAAHKDQKEWRIRNAYSCSNIQHRKPGNMDKKLRRINRNPPMGKEAMIKILAGIDEMRFMNFLSIESKNVVHIIIPKGKNNLLYEKNSNLTLKDIKIIEI